jgi:hypothetical protein
MRKVLYFVLSAIFLAAGSAAFGADFWESKPYDTWSQKECSKLLTDSPWVEDFTKVAEGLQLSTGASDDGQQFSIQYQFQFRSALPVRQAMVRQMQLAQKYDTLGPEQKQQFDQSAKSFLSADFSDVVVVYVTYKSNSQSKTMEIHKHWQTQTMDLLKNNVFLRNSRGEQVALAKFIAPQGAERSFQFIFPREINGKPFIAFEDKSLQLQFSYPIIVKPGGSESNPNDKLGDGNGFLEFKPKKMIFQGNIAY